MKIKSRVFNRKYLKYLKHEQRTQIFFGGSSSGKSYSLAQRTILDVCAGRNYIICRNVQNTIKKSVFNEILKAIAKFKLTEFFIVNKTDLVITFTGNLKQIMFVGLDDTEKIKSITPINGVITDIWIEEATETEYKSIKQLYKRLRGQSKFKKRIILSFNPILKTHWIFDEYFKFWNDNDELYIDENLLIVHSTYKDNKFLTKEDIQLLEDETDQYYYDVYSLGKWGVLGAVIFKNWEIQDLTDIKSYADNIRIGQDFGFSKDESATIIIHYDKKKKIIYVLDEIYQTELSNLDLSNLIKEKFKELNINSNQVVYCDCAEPKSISELRTNKINAYGVKKGPDSINFGIKFLQKHKIIIDKKCQNFKNEISQYKWKENKNGDVLTIPIDKNNHLLDSLRYALENDMLQEDAILFT
ncbi:MAG: PBSX family phage terminase large subunit [Candidatus Hodarchaeota archaeon]